jgi:hypothetical protein
LFFVLLLVLLLLLLVEVCEFQVLLVAVKNGVWA